jgi:glycosyltransferase involved in cell wall biosynthesis
VRDDVSSTIPATPREPAPQKPVRLAYIMSRFPKLTETFILYEILALDALGVSVEIWPLLRERQSVTHAEAAAWVQRAHFQPLVSLPILRAHLHVLARRPRAYLRVVAEVLGGTFGSLNFFVGALGVFPKAVRFAYEMEALRVTHVHAHFATHPALAALIVHRLTGIPFSFTAHGSDLHVDRRMLDRKLEAAAFAVTISQFNREVIVRECGEASRHKVHVVHCGVDSQVFVPRTARSANGPLRILCVASYEEVKGHRYLVEACRLLHERGVDFVCHLVGDGPGRAKVEAQIAAAGLPDRVQMHGPQPRDTVVRLMSQADVMALASVPTRQGKREGIPVAVMEGMASELAVVVSDLSGIPELVEHGVSGLLVAPRDVPGLAAALQRLAADAELRQRLGRAARDKVLREFDLRQSAQALIELFQVAGSRGRA